MPIRGAPETRRGDPQAAFEGLRERGYPETVVELADEGLKKGAEILAPLRGIALARGPAFDGPAFDGLSGSVILGRIVSRPPVAVMARGGTYFEPCIYSGPSSCQ